MRFSASPAKSYSHVTKRRGYIQEGSLRGSGCVPFAFVFLGTSFILTPGMFTQCLDLEGEGQLEGL